MDAIPPVLNGPEGPFLGLKSAQNETELLPVLGVRSSIVLFHFDYGKTGRKKMQRQRAFLRNHEVEGLRM
jgi:hypothetical protein